MSEPPGRIGIWDRVLRADGRADLVRSAACASEWRYWADVERIPARQKTRVVLFGESAARGYFYDPALTPASVLKAMLDGVDVVDLARSDLTATGLGSLFDALPALEADAAVVFAGNNWHNILYPLDDLQRLAGAVRQDGYAASRRIVLDEIVAAQCRSALDRLRAVAPGLPVVVVVPEFNLGDWRGEPSVLAPVLPGGGNVRWMTARAEAERALDAGDLRRALERAAELVALDGGTSAVGHELLARAHLAGGRAREARTALEAARDSVCGLLIAHSPRCPAVAQEVLRAKAAEHGFALVDLPRVFHAELGGALPDRRLFLDYCHLTARGMRVAMAPVAEHLASRLGLRAPSPSPAAALSAEDEAAAHLLAAVHNAHHGQRGEVLRYHLARAVETSPRARQQLRWYLEVQSSPAEQWMCESFERLCESPLVSRYLAASDPSVMERLADVELLGAMADVLGGGGESPRPRAEGARMDLLAPRHRARTFRERHAYSLGPERAFYRALDLSSSFFFTPAAAHMLRVRLTCRLPGAETAAEVVVHLNRSVVRRMEVGGGWSTFDVELSGKALRPGVNELRVEWPLRALPWAEMLEQGARRLERGVYPDVLPAYGEIHALTAVPA